MANPIPEHRGFHMIPNVVERESGMSIIAYRLYGHIKSVVTEEHKVCYEGVRAQAKACDIAPSSVAAGRKELERLGLITSERITKPDGTFYIAIRVVDKWRENEEYMDRVFATRTPLFATRTQEEVAEEDKPLATPVCSNQPLSTTGKELKSNIKASEELAIRENLEPEQLEQLIMSELGYDPLAGVPKMAPPKANNLDYQQCRVKCSQEEFRNPISYSAFRQELKPFATSVVALFDGSPPVESQMSFWHKGVNALKKACGEYGIELVFDIYLDRQKGKLPKFRIANPNALVKTAGEYNARRSAVQQGKVLSANDRFQEQPHLSAGETPNRFEAFGEK